MTLPEFQIKVTLLFEQSSILFEMGNNKKPILDNTIIIIQIFFY